MKRIQRRLAENNQYHGPIDGIYGGGTESAVKAFQRSEGLLVDGLVGPNTWQYLFDEDEVQEPAIINEDLSYRCLALTGSFETGAPPPDCFAGITGDFDGQAISFGALQWNFGQGSLQPLLKKMEEQHSDTLQSIFTDRYAEFQEIIHAPKNEQMDWGRSVQDPNRFILAEPWQGLFKSLGRCKEFQNLQVQAAKRLFSAARELAADYGLESERAVALMFDIKVQNGSIYSYVKEQILRDFNRLPDDAGEEERLVIIANRRAEASNQRWVEDVRRRKLTIARGRGTVHGMHYNLEEDYGIHL